MITHPILSKEEHTLRKLLWLRHGCPHHVLYGDDGEMQCATCRIDFLRMTPEELDQKFYDMGMEKYVAYVKDVPGKSLLGISFNMPDEKVNDNVEELTSKFYKLSPKEKCKHIHEYLRNVPGVDGFATDQLFDIMCSIQE